MLSLMQERPINLARILESAAREHGSREIVTNSVEGGIHRETYRQAHARAQQLARALRRLGVAPGDRVATMGWNSHRHLEAWYAVAGQGAICHTLNPRLFIDQLVFIINDAEDRFLLVDITFVPILKQLRGAMQSVEAVILMTDPDHMPDLDLGRPIHCYETLIAGEEPAFDWPELDERSASSLCYTSGTTGGPKGVLYSHRSNLFHAYATALPDSANLSASSCVLMVVPMFHANSWGLAYSAPMVGAKLVLPGPHLDGASLHRLILEEGCTTSAAVPTIWTMLLQHLEESGGNLGNFKEVLIGGSAVPPSMIEIFRDRYGVEVLHGWGMTEMNPVGCVNRPLPSMEGLGEEEAFRLRSKQGRAMFGGELRIVDANGKELPRDGKSFGHLMVRGPWVIERYFKSDRPAVDAEGWFNTGDVATIDEHGFMQIVDRSKDMIKSGGEWISSVDLENAAVAHPDVRIAAVIGVAHPKWDERPLLLVEPLRPEEGVDEAGILTLLAKSFAKWQLPEAVIVIEQIPLNATGKIDKLKLRERYCDYFGRGGRK